MSIGAILTKPWLSPDTFFRDSHINSNFKYDNSIAGVQIKDDFHLDRKLMAGALFQISERSIFPALSGVVATLICWHCPIHLVSIIHYCQDPLIISHNRMLHLLHGGSLQRVQSICDPSLGWRILFLVHHQIMLDFWTEPSETTPSKSGRKITPSHQLHQPKQNPKFVRINVNSTSI